MKKLFYRYAIPAGFLFILLSLCSNADDIVKPKKVQSIVKLINHNYYNLIDEKVRDIKFNFKLANEGQNLEYLRQSGRFDIANRIDKMDIFVTCYPSRHKIDVTVLDKPFFDDAELDRHVSELIRSTGEVAEEFLLAWKRYVTRLIDPRFNQVKSLMDRDGSVIVELVGRGSKEYRLVFDPEYKLKFWEAFEPFESVSSYKEMPQFEVHDSKYLVKTVHAENFGRFEIAYQSVNGIQVPEEVIFYSEVPNVPDTTMFFADTEVNLSHE